MDLALQLGTTADGLQRTMTEREFGRWRAYANRKMLPQRRIEFYLAQLAMLVVRTMGGRPDAPLAEFMFDPVESAQEAADDAGELTPEDVAEQFGGRVFRSKLKQQYQEEPDG